MWWIPYKQVVRPHRGTLHQGDRRTCVSVILGSDLTIYYQIAHIYSEVVLGEHKVSTEEDCDSTKENCFRKQTFLPAEIITHEDYKDYYVSHVYHACKHGC